MPKNKLLHNKITASQLIGRIEHWCPSLVVPSCLPCHLKWTFLRSFLYHYWAWQSFFKNCNECLLFLCDLINLKWIICMKIIIHYCIQTSNSTLYQHNTIISIEKQGLMVTSQTFLTVYRIRIVIIIHFHMFTN